MQYFTEQYLDFMADLAVNNNKQWFDQNRHRYEEFVREPFKIFVDDLSKALQIIRPDIVLPPHKLMFRINRDVRFAKDKTPYKTGMSAVFNTTKNDELPGFYVSLSIESGLTIAGGVYQPSKEALYDIRKTLQDDPKKLNKLVAKKEFKAKWGELQGDKNKILPAEFKHDAADNPWLFYKQFYYWTDLPFDTALQSNLIEQIVSYCTAGHGINDFFKPIMLETKARLAEAK